MPPSAPSSGAIVAILNAAAVRAAFAHAMSGGSQPRGRRSRNHTHSHEIFPAREDRVTQRPRRKTRGYTPRVSLHERARAKG